jgi:outer membrane protein
MDWGADNYNDQKIFLGMTLNLFNGLKTPQKVKQAYADQKKFVLVRKQAEEGLELAVKNAYEQYALSRDQLRLTENVVKLAQKGYDVSRIAYEVGSRTLLDMQNAELELSKAKIASNGARLAYHLAVIDLKQLMGQMD